MAADDDMPRLSTGQLMAMVRRGASALSRPEVDVNEMLNWSVGAFSLPPPPRSLVALIALIT